MTEPEPREHQARRLIGRGASDERIVELTRLSFSEVLALRAQAATPQQDKPALRPRWLRAPVGWQG